MEKSRECAQKIRCRLCIACAVMLMCACAASPPAARVNLQGYEPAFKQGYADGCASSAGRAVRDEVRYTSDAQYAWGWRDGKDICNRKR